MLYMISWIFVMKRKFVKRNVGYPVGLNAEKSKNSLGLNYISIEKSAEDMVKQMRAQEII